MSRSITYSEPKTTRAGEINTWVFTYKSATPLNKGSRLKFDLESLGRPFDWEIPSISLKNKSNVIWLEIPDHPPITATEVFLDDSKIPQFEFVLPTKIKEHTHVKICLGSPNNAPSKGNRSQHNVIRRRPFHLYVDAKGKGDYKEHEIFYIDVKGNELKNIRIIAPSIVNKNQRFDITLRFEDIFGNLTNFSPKETLIELSYERLRENIKWKLFVPETGFINLPNIYFNETGIYNIELKNLLTNEIFTSSPIKCFQKFDKQIYWGTFHGENVLYDAKKNIESCLRSARDENAYQFYGTSSFDSEQETSADDWKGICSHVAEFNEEDRFTTFLGLQWGGAASQEGLRQIVYLKDSKPILRVKDTKSNHLKKIYKSHTPKDFISIPSFTMGSTTSFNFEEFFPEYEKVVEIYNAWGSSECTKSEGNPRPILSKGKKGIKEKSEGSIRKALNKNIRFGFVAGGLDDRGVYRSLFDSDQIQYSPGVTAIISARHSRDGLIQALNERSCYATTGPRIILGMDIAQTQIGSELNTHQKPGLAYNRHISGYVTSLSSIEEIIIIRNGKVFHTFTPLNQSFEFNIDDDDYIDNIAIKPKKDALPFIYYYMRVKQKDGHLAWASPIWIDVGSNPPIEKKKK